MNLKALALFSLTLLSNSVSIFAQSENKIATISSTLEAWHKAAAAADFETYFGLMTEDGVFLGTDATENWQQEEFRAFSKPYFDKGKAWTFTTLERNVYLDSDSATTAWFDEHLDTQMGICRGSGVMKKVGAHWKVAHYVLSIAVPNEHVAALTAMKKSRDSLQMIKMRKTRSY